MSNTQLKPTFITLGHIRMRRTHLSAIVKDDDKLDVYIGKESPYSIRVSDPEKAEKVFDDFIRLKENNML